MYVLTIIFFGSDLEQLHRMKEVWFQWAVWGHQSCSQKRWSAGQRYHGG